MKQRATVLCRRGDQILLVARLHARWALPGGRPRRRETLADAALRELFEETGLVGRPEAYLFRVEGGRKCHHVFQVEVDPLAVARPAQEIAHCAWVDRQALASTRCSRPTPIIVDLAFERMRGPRSAAAGTARPALVA